MSTILVNNVKSYTGATVTISGSNIAVQGNTTLGDNSGVDTITVNGHITASGNISASGTVFASKFESAGPSNEVIAFNDNLNITGEITASGNIAANGNIVGDSSTNISGINLATITTASIASLTLTPVVAAAATDAAFYILNGKRGEIRSQLQTACAADTGFTIELRNTSIAANSLIVANVIGGEGAIRTGSVLTANTIGASSASFNFFNTGVAIIDNAIFIASFAVL